MTHCTHLKRLALQVSLILSCTLPALADCVDPNPAVTGWWTGDNTVADIANGRDATLMNGATYGTGLVGSGAFSFDGVDDVGSIADTPALDVGSGDFTVNFWVRPTTTGGERVMVEKWNPSNNTGWTLSDRGGLYFAGTGSAIQTSASIPAGVWTHIALRRSGGTVALLKNGVVIDTGTNNNNLDNSVSLIFGRRAGSQGFFFHGRIDEIQLHVGTALSNTEIQAIHAAGADGQCHNLNCGDGNLDPGEDCDDNNETDGDGCDSNCTVTGCGNGIATAGEECDDANGVDTDACTNGCLLNVCGDGITHTGVEECDDANAVDGDGCDTNCTATACGNGILTAGETCDDGNATDGDGCDSNCTPTGCQNGVVTDGEQCDDGNAVDGDSCDSNCTTGCGNGITAASEECDDGNNDNGDGCDANCTFTGCGNGVRTAGEWCDDGTGINGDGCDNTCTFSGCGNGLVGGTEVCDDANSVNGDGCDNNCTVTACGNGVPTAGEMCVETIDPNLSWDTAPFGGGGNDIVTTVAKVGSDLYVGGWFTEFAGTAANGVVKWDGVSWQALGSGIDGWAETSAVIGTTVYVGGSFSVAGGTPAAHIARWDGSSWSALGSGLDGDALTAVAIGTDLYVGGAFSEAGGVPANNIARWNGSSWSTLGTGFDDAVTGLAVAGTDLYAVGHFSQADGVAASYVAKWNGSSWSSVGNGLPDGAFSVAVQNGVVWATGDGYVARWNGTTWLVTPLQGSFGYRLVVDGFNVFLGGDFTGVGGVVAKNVAWWNGAGWNALGSGVNDQVAGMFIDGDSVYVTGSFTNAGGRSAGGIAIWHMPSCGDGFVAQGEICDDSNLVDGDGCDGNCTITACGNGVTSIGTGEECDDGNLGSGDGCDSNCTPTACGNGVLSTSTGETCDDGNLDDGDGCEGDCGYTPVSEVAPPGGTVTTDPGGNGATPEIPTQVSLTTNTGGLVTINSTTSTVEVDGVQFIGVAIQIEAQAGSPESPLEIKIVIDPSVLPPGVDGSRLDVVRDATPLDDCVSPTMADPDPCLAGLQVLPSGDLEFTALTSHASRWQMAVRGQSRDEQKCVNAMNLSGLKVSKAQVKANNACLKAASKGTEGDPQGCLTADTNGKIAAAMTKTATTETGKCPSLPPFGFADSSVVNAAGQAAALALVADVFGADLNAVVIPAADREGAGCQSAVLKSVQKLFDTKAKLFLKCKKSGLSGKTSLMVSSSHLQACFEDLTADVDGKLAKAAGKLATTFAKKCDEVNVATTITGMCGSSGNPAECLDTGSSCHLCRMLNAVDDLSEYCDSFDDGMLNASCP